MFGLKVFPCSIGGCAVFIGNVVAAVRFSPPILAPGPTWSNGVFAKPVILQKIGR